jgi:hypothetical protein
MSESTCELTTGSSVEEQLRAMETTHQQTLAAIQQQLQAVRVVFDAEDATLAPGELALKELFDAQRDLAEAETQLRERAAERALQEQRNNENMRLLREEMFRTQRALSEKR